MFLEGLVLLAGVAKTIGQLKANADEARARRINAGLLRDEADYLLKSLDREEEVLQSETTQVLNLTEARASANGMQMSGSLLDNLAATVMKSSKELDDLRYDVRRKAYLMRRQAELEESGAGRLTDFGTVGLTALGAGLGTATSVAQIADRNKGRS